MSETFNMPKFGMTMEEGTVHAWHKKEGDSVKTGELLLDVESDKAIMEVMSDADGTLEKILVQEGEVRKCGEPLAVIG
ncbi:MAG: biotin/lipoyl-containing protein [bacterium]|nr:biotin attachment protein [Candidatus Sumerlaeota bacterium]